MNADKFNQIPRLLYAMLAIFMAAFIAAPACAQNAFNHIVVVIEENHDYNQVIGNPSMPYFNSLANNYGVATQYYANTHPSIGNYFMLTTGQILTNDDTKIPSSFPVSDDNIVRHLIAAGRSWKSYAEDLPSVGHIGDDFNGYRVHHNPFPYFTDVQNDSTQRNNLVPFADPNAGFAHDLANNSLPNYSFVVPNACNDAHDCALSVADTWLLTNIGPLISNATLMKDTLVIILFDEADTDSTDGGGKVYWVAAGPNVNPGYVSSTLYQHQSTLRETLEGLGLPYNLAAAATAPGMGEFFKPVQCTTTCDTTPPSVPMGLTATSVGGLQVILSWTASTDPDSPVAGYKVYRNGNPNPIGTTAVATYTDNTVSPGTTYTYTAAAYDPANNLSAQSSPVTVTTACPSCPPSVPTGLTATSVSSSQVSLSWTDADSTVAGYQIYRDGNVINTTTATSYTDNAVSAGTTYTYTVAASNAAGVPSAQSSPVTVTTPCTSCGPSVPTGLTATSVSSSQVSLSWTDADSTVAGYQIYRDGNVIATATVANYTDNTVSQGTTYTYTVAAYNAAGIPSAQSSSLIVATPCTSCGPSVPTDLTVTSVSSSQVSFSWTDADSTVAGYQIYRDGNVIDTTTVANYTDYTVNRETTYSYTVAAYNAAGVPSAQSSSLIVTTTPERRHHRRR